MPPDRISLDDVFAEDAPSSSAGTISLDDAFAETTAPQEIGATGGDAPATGPAASAVNFLTGPATSLLRGNLNPQAPITEGGLEALPGDLVSAAGFTAGMVAGGGAIKLASNATKLTGLAKGAFEILAGTLGFELGSQTVEQGAQLAKLKEDTDVGDDLKQAAFNVGVGLTAPVVIKAVAKPVGGIFRLLGGLGKNIGLAIDDLLDPKRALSRAFTDNIEEYRIYTGQDTIVNILDNLEPIIKELEPNKKGEIFGDIFKRLQSGVAPTGRAIDKVIDVSKRRLKAKGIESTVKFGEILDLSKFKTRADEFIPGVEKKIIGNLLQQESDNVAKQILSEGDFITYQAARTALKRLEKKVGKISLLGGNAEEALEKLSGKDAIEFITATNRLELVSRKIENAPLDIDDVVRLKRRFGVKANYGKTRFAGETDVTRAEIYRDLETAFRTKIADFVELAGDDTAQAFTNLNTRFASLRRVLPMADIRQAEEVAKVGQLLPGGVSILGGSSGLRGRIAERLIVPPQADLAISKGTSALSGLGELSGPSKILGGASSLIGRGVGAIDTALTPEVSVLSSRLLLEGATAEAEASILGEQEKLVTKSEEFEIDFNDFPSAEVSGDDVFLEEPADQQELLNDYMLRVEDGDLPLSHLAEQASTFNDPTRSNLLISLPKKVEKPKGEKKIRLSTGSLTKPAQYAY